MNNKYKELYNYLLDNKMTSLDENSFYDEYSQNDEKFSKLYSYLQTNKMTSLDPETFKLEYFGTPIIKKKSQVESTESDSEVGSLEPSSTTTTGQLEPSIYILPNNPGALYRKKGDSWLKKIGENYIPLSKGDVRARERILDKQAVLASDFQADWYSNQPKEIPESQYATQEQVNKAYPDLPKERWKGATVTPIDQTIPTEKTRAFEQEEAKDSILPEEKIEPATYKEKLYMLQEGKDNENFYKNPVTEETYLYWLDNNGKPREGLDPIKSQEAVDLAANIIGESQMKQLSKINKIDKIDLNKRDVDKFLKKELYGSNFGFNQEGNELTINSYFPGMNGDDEGLENSITIDLSKSNSSSIAKEFLRYNLFTKKENESLENIKDTESYIDAMINSNGKIKMTSDRVDVISEWARTESMAIENDLKRNEVDVIDKDIKSYEEKTKLFKKRVASGNMTQQEFDKENDDLSKLYKDISIKQKRAQELSNRAQKLISAEELIQTKGTPEEKGNTIGALVKSFTSGMSNLALTGLDYSLAAGNLIMGDEKFSKLIDGNYGAKKAKGLTDAQIANAAQATVKDFAKEKYDLGWENITGTNKEYIRSKNRGMIPQALNAVAESFGTAATGGALGKVGSTAAFFSMSYNAMEDQMRGPDFDHLNENEKKLISVPYGLVIGQMEKWGFDVAVGAGKNPLFNKFANYIVTKTFKNLPKNAGLIELNSAIQKNIGASIAKGLIKITGAGVSEGNVEFMQQEFEGIQKFAVNEILKNDNFNEEYFKDAPDLSKAGGWSELMGQGVDAFKLGFLAGGMTSAGASVKDNITDISSNNKFDIYKSFVLNTESRNGWIASIKEDQKNGKISPEEMNKKIDELNKSYSVLTKIPASLTTQSQREAFSLLQEREIIQNEIKDKDPNLVVKETNRIKEINESLKTTSENATKEDNIKQQEGTAEGGISEYQGTGEGQQEVGVSQGGQRETTINEADSGDSTVASKVQQEEQVATYRTEEQAELLKAIPKIESYKVNGEIDKTLMPKTVLAKYNKIYDKYDNLITPLLETTGEVAIDKPIITTNTTAEVQRVKSLTPESEDGATFNIDGTKYEGVGLVVPVDSMNTTTEELTPEMVADFVAERQKMIGDAGVVKAGIYKFPNSNQVSIDLSVVVPETSREQALEFARLAGQESLFDLETFENIKTGATGENPMKFTPEQHREISKALKEGRMPNVFGTTAETTKNLLTKENVKEVEIKQTTPKNKLIVKAAKMVLNAIPGVKIYIHNNGQEMASAIEASKKQLTKEEKTGLTESSGLYVDGNIHINLESATIGTVYHEAFHALIEKNGIKSGSILLMAKGLKNIISDKGIKQRLDDFVSQYNEDEKAEEYISELGGILSEAEQELTTTKLQQFKTLINNIAKKLGLPVIFSASATAQDAADFINTMSKKLRTGEEIKDLSAEGKDGKIKRQVEKLFLGETPKFKSLDDVSKYIQSWVNENKLFDKSIEEVSDQVVIDKFSEHVLNEIRAWESIKGSEYVGFYNEDIPQRLNPELQKFAKQRYGRELTGEEVSLYHMVSAFASPSADPHFDSSKGLEVFDKYMMTGNLSAYGTEQATIWDTDSKGKRYDTGKLKFDDKSNPVYKQVAKAYATTSLEKFNNIVNNFNGDVSKAVNWVLSNHSFDDASKMMGKPTTGAKANQLDENEYFTKENGGTGVFAITGAKLGSYILNRIGNYSTVTKDMWYARTLARLAGESLTEKGKAIKSPWASNTKQGLRKRKLADKAFEIVAKELGTSPADVQQKIWDFEKRLYEKLGAVEKTSYASEGLKSKAKQILSQQPSKIKFQKNKTDKLTAPVAGNKLFNEPLKQALDIAKSYMKSIGKEYIPVEKITKLDEGLSKRISDAYDQMKDDPTDPEVKAAYEAMAKETLDQYDAITAKGYKVEINNNEPYSSSEDMINDLRDNNRMKIFSTESGFGEEPITEKQREENILLKDSGRKDANGETLLVNDVFRFVHDFFGHAKLGNSFGPIGEENAWRVHSEMYSPEAKKAMTSETRGQNSWVNFSGVNDAAFKKREKARQLRKEGKIDQANQMVGEVYDEMKFADQKIGLLPSFAVEEGKQIKKQKVLTSDIGINRSEIPLDKSSENISIGKMTSSNGNILELSAKEINLSYPGKKKFVRRIEAIDKDGKKAIISFWRDKSDVLEKDNMIILHVEGVNGYGTDLINTLISESKEDGVKKIIADDVLSLNAAKYWEDKLGFSKDPDDRSIRVLDLDSSKKQLTQNWVATPVKSMKDSPIAKNSDNLRSVAIDLAKGKINQGEYADAVKKYSPIGSIGTLFAPSTLSHMITALGKKADKLMAPVVDELGKKIKRVGLRLDIPSYLHHNAWIVTVHDGRVKDGNVISYRNAARLKNVEFTTDPRVALNIAAGFNTKTTFARMVGEMVDIPGETAEEQGLNGQAMVEEIMNDPSWVQVGMNPFRHSFFWNRANGAPVVSADEVIQVGGLVYAKNVIEASPNSDRFTVYGKYDEAKNKVVASEGPLLDKSGSKIKFQKPAQERRMDDEAEAIFKKSLDRGVSWNVAVQNVIDYIQISKWYENASDIDREQKIRDFRQSKKQKLKKAPSVDKILGTPKPSTVTVIEKTALKDQIKLEARTAREAKGDLNQKRKLLSTAIKGLVKLGKLTARQAGIIIERVGYVNLDNQVMVDRLADYAARVFEKADYQERLSRAFLFRKGIRKLLKGDIQAEVVGMAKKFSKIDPSMVDDIEKYLEMAEIVKNAIKPSRVNRKDLDVNMRESMNIDSVSEFTNDAIENQEAILKEELLAVHSELVDAGVIDDKMSLKDIESIINSLKEEADDADYESDILTFLSRRIDTMSAIIKDILIFKINPMTGEDVALTEKNIDLISRMLNIDINNVSIKEAIFIAEAMDNFINNNITSSVEAVIEKQEGATELENLIADKVVASPLRKYFSTYAGQFFSEQVASMPILFEKLFVGAKKGLMVAKKMGWTALINGVNKAEKMFNTTVDVYFKQYKNTKPNGKSFNDAENVYERGMLAFLSRNVSGTVTQQAEELKRRVEVLKESVKSLLEGSSKEQKMGELYQKIYDKLNVESGDIDVIHANADKINRSAVGWWINQWGTTYSDLSDISLSVYNTMLSSDTSYSTDRYKLLDKANLEEIIEPKNIGAFGRDIEFLDKNKTGVLMESNRPSASKVSKANRYISLDFDINNSSAYKAALIDVNTAAAIRRIDGFINSKNFNKLIPTKEDRDIFRKRISEYIQAAKNKRVEPSDTMRLLDQLTNFLGGVGVAKALGGIDQVVKQTLPIALSTFVNSGRFDLVMPGSSASVWIDSLGMAISNRGQESQSTIESVDRRLEKASGLIDKSTKAFVDVQQFWLKYFLSKPDVFIAKSSFISYYKQYLSNNNQSTDIDWATHNVNQDAADYAMIMVDRQQNVSDTKMAGKIFSSQDSTKKIMRKIFLPFASFSLNQKSRMVSDIKVLGMNSGASKQDKAIAARSLASLPFEMALYQSMSLAIRLGYLAIAKGIIGAVADDDDEEKEKLLGMEISKELKNATKYPLRSMITDFLSPAPVLDNLVVGGANALLRQSEDKEMIDDAVDKKNLMLEVLGKDKMNEDQKEKFIKKFKKDHEYQLFNDEQKSYGTIGIGIDLSKEIMDNAKTAYTGQYTDDYMGKESERFLLPKDQDNIKNAVIFETLFALGLLPRDVNTVTKNIIKLSKKNSLTEKQYEKYEAVGKETGAKVTGWKMDLTKSKSKLETTVSEIEWIEKHGGLNEKQGKEYVKLSSVVDEVSYRDLQRIQSGKTADQIINSYSKK